MVSRAISPTSSDNSREIGSAALVAETFGEAGVILHHLAWATEGKILDPIPTATVLLCMAAILTVAETARRHGHRPSAIFYALLTQPPSRVPRRLYAAA